MYCILHASREPGLEDCRWFMLVANPSVHLTIACLEEIRFVDVFIEGLPDTH